jgi:hypothetical protein
MDQVSSSSFNFMGPYLSGPESFLLVKNTFFCARPNGSPNFKVLYRIYSVYLFPLISWRNPTHCAIILGSTHQTLLARACARHRMTSIPCTKGMMSFSP